MRRGWGAVLVVLAACVAAPLQNAPLPPHAPMRPEPIAVAPATAAVSPPPDARAWLAKMTLEDKVGQLMMVGFAGKSVDPAITTLVRGYRVGGVCLFGRNVDSSTQIGTLNDDVRGLLEDWVPPFIAVDQEGGNVVRLTDGNIVLPGNMVLGAARQPALAYEAGLAQGEDLKRLGFNMNLAPVLDVNSNPQNPVIGLRAFGDDVALVSQLGSEFVRGQQDAQIVTVAKHFPGHGGVDTDSHRSLPVMRGSLREVRKALQPFEAAMKSGLDGLMTAHIAMPALSGDETPATLSRRVLGGVLRDEMAFDGLVLTDELEMDAIDRHYGVGRAAVLAINAGADMVLIPWRLEKKEEVWLTLLDAVRGGEISIERLDRAVLRILTLKVRRGLFETPAPLSERLAALGAKRGLSTRIAAAGITLIRTEGALFPLASNQRVAVISAEPTLITSLQGRFSALTSLAVPAIPDANDHDGIKVRTRALAAKADIVVVGIINSRQLELVTIAALTGKPVVAVVLGAPYLAAQAHEAKVVLATYSWRAAATEAAAASLSGEVGTPGRLPVTLPRTPFGSGLDPVGHRVVVIPVPLGSGAGRGKERDSNKSY